MKRIQLDVDPWFLPPAPWSVVKSDKFTHELIDANGRRIATLYGGELTKQLVNFAVEASHKIAEPK